MLPLMSLITTIAVVFAAIVVSIAIIEAAVTSSPDDVMIAQHIEDTTSA